MDNSNCNLTKTHLYFSSFYFCLRLSSVLHYAHYAFTVFEIEYEVVSGEIVLVLFTKRAEFW